MECKYQTRAVKQRAAKNLAVPVYPKPDKLVVAMRHTVQRIRSMSHEQRVESLKKAGILTSAGKLSPSYR
jgi:hypothetical protein